MKSEITNRGYFIFLICVLTISTYQNFIVFTHQEHWKEPMIDTCLYIITSLLHLYLWYAIIRKHKKLLLGVIIWATISILAMAIEYLNMIFHEHASLKLFQNIMIYVYIIVFLIVLLGGKKYIILNIEKSQEISN